jgi:hypothetical protein
MSIGHVVAKAGELVHETVRCTTGHRRHEAKRPLRGEMEVAVTDRLSPISARHDRPLLVQAVKKSRHRFEVCVAT